MENNNNNYQVLNKNPQPDINPQQEYGSYVQPYNAGNMHPYNAGQPSITYNVAAQPITEKNLPEEFKPISAWGYIGYNLLFSIPIIGTIMLFVYAFGGTSKINLRNYARSFFLCSNYSYCYICIFYNNRRTGFFDIRKQILIILIVYRLIEIIQIPIMTPRVTKKFRDS